MANKTDVEKLQEALKKDGIKVLGITEEDIIIDDDFDREKLLLLAKRINQFLGGTSK
jgi:Mrp family chromosome partitioning ATPase